MEIADIYVNRLKTESEKVDMILSFLDKKPYTEVRFRITRSKATAKEVFNVLRDIYGSKDSWTQLQQQFSPLFYNRQQGSAESVNEFSFELMALIMKMEKKHPTLVLYPDKLLKERFAEGVRDVSLKREMRRLNKERPDMKFFEICDEANEWCKDESMTNREIATQESVTSPDPLHHCHHEAATSPESAQLSEIVKVMQQQQDQLKQLGESVYGAPPSQYNRGRDYSRGRSRGWNRGHYRGRGRGEFGSRSISTDHQKQESSTKTEPQQEPKMAEPLLCHYCKEPNHFERYCLKRKRDRKMQSTNYYHSR